MPGSGFGTGLASLVAALNTDFDWLREHTRYLQRAIEWDKGGRPANRLLSGNDILEAKAWAARRPKSAPEPTALHLDFIRASEDEAETRSSAERRRLVEMASAQDARATALANAEGALRQAAEAQRKRGRLRNWLLVVMTLATVTLVWTYSKIKQETQRADRFINLVSSDPAGTRAMKKICQEAIEITSTLATTSDKTQMQRSLDRISGSFITAQCTLLRYIKQKIRPLAVVKSKAAWSSSEKLLKQPPSSCLSLRCVRVPRQ